MFEFKLPHRANQPVIAKPLSPEGREASDRTGNAGLDGYTRLSAAERRTGSRFPIAGDPVFQGPRFNED